MKVAHKAPGRCIGCELLATALPLPGDLWDLIAAIVTHRAGAGDIAREDVVVMVGFPPSFPKDLCGRGRFTLGAVSRIALDARGLRGLRGLHLRPPAGSTWVVMGFRPTNARDSGLLLFPHPVPAAASADAMHLTSLALIPADGGPAPGETLTGPGGRA